MHDIQHNIILWPLVAYLAAILLLVTVMVGSSHVLGPRFSARATGHPFESGIIPYGDARVRFPVQFYLVAMFFVIFDLEMVFIFGWSTVVYQTGWQGYWAILAFLVLLTIALGYLWRSGALEWRTYIPHTTTRGQG
jgi:NADH-quinone oxidoreductase subunit A